MILKKGLAIVTAVFSSDQHNLSFLLNSYLAIKDSSLTWATILRTPLSNQFEDDCGHKLLTTDHEDFDAELRSFRWGGEDQILVEFGLNSF